MQPVLSAFKTNPLAHAEQAFYPPHNVQLEMLQIGSHVIVVIYVIPSVLLVLLVQLVLLLEQFEILVVVMFFLNPALQNSQVVSSEHIWQFIVVLRHEGKQDLLFEAKENPL